MAVSADAMLIAGAILVVAIVFFISWATRNKEKPVRQNKEDN